jgi:hypothetical protein
MPMSELELIWRPESGEPQCCEMFDSIVHSDEWTTISNHANKERSIVAAAVDSIMAKLGVFTILPELLARADETLGGLPYLKGCSELFAARLAAAT